MNNIILSDNATKRVIEIIGNKSDSSAENPHQNPQTIDKFLRLTVKGGGCNGFQYIFELDNKNLEDDIIICEIDGKIIAKTDKISTQFIEGATIDFVDELGASYFKVVNPNATSNCGCGSSFGV